MERIDVPRLTVYAAHPWKTNALLIRDGVVPLGYLGLDWDVLDPTYGNGRTAGGWWRLWRPDHLEAHDLALDGMDFRVMPQEWKRRFRAVAYDAPYKMNGKPSPEVDARYGVDRYMSPRDRQALMVDGFVECYSVLDWGGFLLAKCQDQVCGGHVHWQTDWYSDAARALGMEKVDRFDIVGRSRAQPARKRKDGKPSVQQHARRNGSTLLVFEKQRRPRSNRPR